MKIVLLVPKGKDIEQTMSISIKLIINSLLIRLPGQLNCSCPSGAENKAL
jgi:hypothetical protein